MTRDRDAHGDMSGAYVPAALALGVCVCIGVVVLAVVLSFVYVVVRAAVGG